MRAARRRSASSCPASGSRSSSWTDASVVAVAGPAALAVRPEVDQEREDHEEPLEADDVVAGAPVPERGVGERGPRQQEEAEQRDDPAVERPAEDVAEDGQQEERQARGDQCDERKQAAHARKLRSPRSRARSRPPATMRRTCPKTPAARSCSARATSEGPSSRRCPARGGAWPASRGRTPRWKASPASARSRSAPTSPIPPVCKRRSSRRRPRTVRWISL